MAQQERNSIEAGLASDAGKATKARSSAQRPGSSNPGTVPSDPLPGPSMRLGLDDAEAPTTGTGRCAQAICVVQAPRSGAAPGRLDVRAPSVRGISLYWSMLAVTLVPALLSGGLFFFLGRWDVGLVGVGLAYLGVATVTFGCARRHARALARALQQLAQRADQLTARQSGEVPLPERCDLAAVTRSFDVMAHAVTTATERARAALEAETQNGVDLQRQYALMQLLRNLASAAQEGGSLDGTLKNSLEEIGRYLDWPVGRLVIVAQDPGAEEGRAQTHWYAADPERFADFIEAYGQGPADIAHSGLIGRAVESSLSHWITDLGRLEDWPPRVAAKVCGLRTAFVIPIAAAPDVTAFVEFFADHRIEASAEMLELVEAISVELWHTAGWFRSEAPKRSGEARARRLALVVEHMEEAVMLVGADGRIEWTNAGLVKMLGTTPDQCLGKSVPALLFPDDATSAVPCQRHLESGERVSGLVLTARKGAAAVCSYELEIQPLPGVGPMGGTRPAGCFVLARDITHTRTTQEALSEALETARQASQAKSQFLANMSHEIRTPMNGVLGMAELLLGTTLDDRQRRFVESLYRSGEALLEILNDILDFSKIEAGKLELQAVDFELRGLIDDLVELLAPRAHQKRIELAYRLSPGLPPVVHGDPTRLRQVLILSLIHI